MNAYEMLTHFTESDLCSADDAEVLRDDATDYAQQVYQLLTKLDELELPEVTQLFDEIDLVL